jgi:hypothetical protein
MIGYVAKTGDHIAASTDDIGSIICYEGTKIYLYDLKKTKIYHAGEWYDYQESNGGGSSVIEDGSIVTSMFAEDAKAPLAGIADNVATDGITDASTIGKALLTASTSTVARTAIGAGTGNSNLAVGSTVGASLSATANAGVSTQAARADHVHPYPTAANIGAAPTSHNHTIGDVTGLQAGLDSKLTATMIPATEDSVAADIETLVSDFNALLSKMRASGIIE